MDLTGAPFLIFGTPITAPYILQWEIRAVLANFSVRESGGRAALMVHALVNQALPFKGSPISHRVHDPS